MEHEGIKFIIALTMGFSLAFIFGFFARKIHLSPILGYLLAGYLIGPYSPGYVADPAIAEQLSELGIILLMFGVGLHFNWADLIKVKNIAIPGAILQTTVATILAIFLIVHNGGTFLSALIMGLAIGVASTAVLVRMLSDNHLLATPQGHIAVGWLVVEDLITILILILLPQVKAFQFGSDHSAFETVYAIVLVVIKLAILAVVIRFLVHAIAKKIMVHVSRTRSDELFTLALLTIIFAVTSGAALIFGVSVALGAFISGMVVKQTDASHQAEAITLPMKDAFAALFFISVGMLFNPMVIIDHFWLFVGLFLIIIIAKPLVAFVIVYLYRYPVKVAFIVAIALAQIGEFSFILAEEARHINILPREGYDLLVACSLISIAINPLLFTLYHRFENHLYFFGRSPKKIEKEYSARPYAIIIGYGPIGRSVSKILSERNIEHTIIDHNIDTITEIKNNKLEGIFGDAAYPNILEGAKISKAHALIITIPNVTSTLAIVQAARTLMPSIKILARVQYINDREWLQNQKVEVVCTELESIKAFHNALERLVKSRFT